MANLTDTLIAQFRLDPSGFSADAANAETLIRGLIGRLQIQGTEIERLAKNVAYSFETTIKNLGKLFGVYLTFDGFRRLIDDATTASISLANFAKITNQDANAANKLSTVVRESGGSDSAIRAFLQRMTIDLVKMNLAARGDGYTYPDWFSGISQVLEANITPSMTPLQIMFEANRAYNEKRRKLEAAGQDLGKIQGDIAAGLQNSSVPKDLIPAIFLTEEEFNKRYQNAPDLPKGALDAGTELTKSLVHFHAEVDVLGQTLLTKVEPALVFAIGQLTQLVVWFERLLSGAKSLDSVVKGWIEAWSSGAGAAAGTPAPGYAPAAPSTPNRSNITPRHLRLRGLSGGSGVTGVTPKPYSGVRPTEQSTGVTLQPYSGVRSTPGSTQISPQPFGYTSPADTPNRSGISTHPIWDFLSPASPSTPNRSGITPAPFGGVAPMPSVTPTPEGTVNDRWLSPPSPNIPGGGLLISPLSALDMGSPLAGIQGDVHYTFSDDTTTQISTLVINTTADDASGIAADMHRAIRDQRGGMTKALASVTGPGMPLPSPTASLSPSDAALAGAGTRVRAGFGANGVDDVLNKTGYPANLAQSAALTSDLTQRFGATPPDSQSVAANWRNWNWQSA